MKNGENVGLAFQGGCYLAGAIETGVVHALVDRKVFEAYNISAFSGTSAGALVAAMCWKHKLLNDLPDLPGELQRQWLENANGFIPFETAGEFWKVADRWMLLNPAYFGWKDGFIVPLMHKEFRHWLTKYIEPEKCMRALFTQYVAPFEDEQIGQCLTKARELYYGNYDRPRLAVGTAEIHEGEVVTIDDADLFEALLDAFKTARAEGNALEAARARAIEVGAEYTTRGLMTSGSLDTINGTTKIDDLPGLQKEDLLHKGEYLDGAYSQNPPISPLTNCDVDQIWTVEIFPKRCDAELDSNEKREDRKEELLQNAPLEHQYQFINLVNFWIASGRLKPLSETEFNTKWEQQTDWKKSVIAAFKHVVPHPERYEAEEDLKKAIGDKLTKKYKMIRTRTLSLPPDLQPLTDGARIVNSRAFLIDKMNRGYQNTLHFLDDLH